MQTKPKRVGRYCRSQFSTLFSFIISNLVISLLPQNFHDFFFILGTRRCPCLVQCSPQVSCQFSFHNYGGSNFSSCTVRRNKTTKSNNKIDCKLPYSNCCALALCAQSTFYKYNKNISLGLNFFLSPNKYTKLCRVYRVYPQDVYSVHTRRLSTFSS